MADVHLISVEAASYLDVALQTRSADEPFPPCPVCRERPAEVQSWRDILREPRLRFSGCGHVIGLDMNTWDDWCAMADANPWVEMFEEYSHQQQIRARREGAA